MSDASKRLDWRAAGLPHDPRRTCGAMDCPLCCGSECDEEDYPVSLPSQFRCAVCNLNPIDAAAGYDTCDDCLKKQ